jgi:hypothetical protein
MLIIMLFAIRQIDSHQQDSGEKIEFFRLFYVVEKRIS